MRLSPLDIKKQEFSRTIRRGYDPDEVHAFIDMLAGQWEDLLAEHEHLRVVGLMTLASPAADPEDVRPQFRRLRTLFETSSSLAPMSSLSMGMSGDFDVAIEEGATHVRLGTILFGRRP